MITPPNRQVLRVVEPAAVESIAERRLAMEHWLLSAYAERGRDQARFGWRELGVAVFPCGTIFSAVRIPGKLVQALAGPVPAAADELLDQALDGGPVICDPHHLRYYALVPASMPRTWSQAVDDWREMDVEVLGRDSYVGVPRVDQVEPNPDTSASYWSVPMSSTATLCAPLAVARLIAAGRHQIVDESEA